jgi:Flp pilus assembly protein TadG
MRPRKKRAQSLVEMALISPILLTMLIGVIDLGRAAYDYATLSAAVREGARVATLTGNPRMSNADVINAIKTYAVGLPLSGAPCVNGRTGPPVTPVTPAAPNAGIIYITSGSASTPTINAPACQASASVVGSCAAVNPAMGGRYQLTIRVVYNFQTLTPFIQQFLGSSTVYMIVTSTVTTEY